MDVPSEAPHKVAGKAGKGGLDALKKLPPWAWILIAGGILVAVMFMRGHQSTAAAQADASGSSDSTGSSTDAGTADNSSGAYGVNGDTSGDYDTGYQQGLQAGGIDTGSGGGTNSSGNSPNDPATDTAGLITSLFPNGVNPAQVPIGPTTINFPTGGGMPVRKKNTHQPVKPHKPPPAKKPPAKKPPPKSSKKPPPKSTKRTTKHH